MAKYKNLIIVGILIIFGIGAIYKNLTQKTETNIKETAEKETTGKIKCEWLAISQKYKSGVCTGSLKNEEATIELKKIPIENVKLNYALSQPCEKSGDFLFCRGQTSECSIISETPPFKVKCPSLVKPGRIEFRFLLPLEIERECYNSYFRQPANTCWFGEARLYFY